MSSTLSWLTVFALSERARRSGYPQAVRFGPVDARLRRPAVLADEGLTSRNVKMMSANVD